MRKYKVRYSVEPWNKEPEVPPRKTVQPGIAVSPNDYGYCDEILVVSILHDIHGEVASLAFFDTKSGCGQPSRKLMEMVRKSINHYLLEHCPEE